MMVNGIHVVGCATQNTFLDIIFNAYILYVMASKSKTKGKTYERQVCEHLTKVFGKNFIRVPNSGAFVGGLNASRTASLTPEQILLSEGDIIVPIELQHVKFECKTLGKFSFSNLFTGSAQLDDWIKQAEDSKRLLWFLVFKIDNRGQFIAFDFKWDKDFKLTNNWMIYKKDQQAYMVTSLDNFFENNKDIILNLPNATLPSA
jgi:hypothetical protein